MKVSDKYLSLVDKFIFMGISLKHIAINYLNDDDDPECKIWHRFNR